MSLKGVSCPGPSLSSSLCFLVAPRWDVLLQHTLSVMMFSLTWGPSDHGLKPLKLRAKLNPPFSFCFPRVVDAPVEHVLEHTHSPREEDANDDCQWCHPWSSWKKTKPEPKGGVEWAGSPEMHRLKETLNEKSSDITAPWGKFKKWPSWCTELNGIEWCRINCKLESAPGQFLSLSLFLTS